MGLLVYSAHQEHHGPSSHEAGFIFLFLVSVYKVPFNICECIYLVSFWGVQEIYTLLHIMQAQGSGAAGVELSLASALRTYQKSPIVLN